MGAPAARPEPGPQGARPGPGTQRLTRLPRVPLGAHRYPPEADKPVGPRRTAVRHLVLGFFLLVAILFTASLCSLPR